LILVLDKGEDAVCGIQEVRVDPLTRLALGFSAFPLQLFELRSRLDARRGGTR
jgi:hypothetical protein